ncbi:uncharacterized protein RHOBADRAFT_42959 [Rhodotorula graminis WP1]|uniref:Uncharacterized protein n=1 Tax=Rhodotorula graminis (strain WP1) TaxID=578459 RepID=A0A194S803_RHOGW|nr:uncharacterized protein RHOBADRAFT_42959 [Rhodotorula graminis WP1]KPV76615.1 hypothetical protein RHOBADRAFT_42959 [Rhodotorula graminis WP1]
MSHLYDLDGDGYYDTATYDGSTGYYEDPYAYSDVGGLGGGIYDDYGRHSSGYEGVGEMWGYGDAYPDLYDYTSFVDETMGLYDAWGDDSWDQGQYALADLMHFQHQLELDYALDESERLRRWEERLAWEQLSDAERGLRYSEYASMGALGTLGLASGWWGRRYGGVSHDLSYLRQVPVQRGLFAPQYRSSFSRFPSLARQYSPYFSPQRLRAFGGAAGSRMALGGVGGMPINPRSSAPYHSQRLSLSSGPGLSLREQELRSRLRVAEMRASLTGLAPAQRARALDDARQLRAQLNAESRAARSIDRAERRSDAVLAAQEVEAERAALRDEVEEQRGIARLERAAGDLIRPMLGGYGAGAGYGQGGGGAFY